MDLIVLALLALATDEYPRQPAFDVQSYAIDLDVDVEHERLACTSRMEISVVDRSVRELLLDYAGPPLARLLVDERPARFEARDDRLHVALAPGDVADGRLWIESSYEGKPARGFYFAQSRHERKLAYTDCWPENARGFLPCIDHPSDRARVQLRILAPEDLQVIANGTQVAKVAASGRKTEYRFEQALPIATYLIAAAVAPLEAIEYHTPSLDARKLPLVTLTYPEEHAAAAAGFAPAPQVLAALEDLAGPYPFSKLALVQIPTRFGGMENASCIFLNQSCLQRGEPLTPLIAHEMAHQWFGDLVGIADWGELWLSEGFATYLTVLVQEKIEGRAALGREMDRKRIGLLASEEARTRAIRDRHVGDPERALGSLHYDKGAFVLHMLRRKLGDAAFFRALKEHAAENALRVCTTEDFRAVAERAGEQSLKTFFDQWIDRPGYPELALAYRVEEREPPVLVVDVEQRQPDPFDLVLDATLTFDGRPPQSVTLATALRKATLEIPLPARPKSVTFNDESWLLARIDGP